jgi:hypothetical protein
MHPRPARTRVLFLVVLSSIAAVYVVGRLWMERGDEPASTEAGLAPLLRAEPETER